MPYEIVLRLLAALEVVEAYDWYELQREGLGNEFLSSLESFYESLQCNLESFSYYEAPVRQGKIDRFPNLVVYEVVESLIVIYSVFMSKQQPESKRTL